MDRSADRGAADSSAHTSEEAEIKLLSPAVNLEAPVLDDSVRCRMAGICEGLDACGRGMWHTLWIYKPVFTIPSIARPGWAVLGCAVIT